MTEILGNVHGDIEVMIGASAGRAMVQRMAYFFGGKEVGLELGVRERRRRNLAILHFKLLSFQTGVIYL